MAAISRIKLKVHLGDDGQVSEVLVSQATKCRDIVLRLQRQIHHQDCCLVELWQGCERLVPEEELIHDTLLDWGSDLLDVTFHLRPNEEVSTVISQADLNDEIPMLEDIESNYGLQHISSRNGLRQGSQSSFDEELFPRSGQLSLERIHQIVLQQQQQIAEKEQELSTKERQLQEIKKRAQNKINNTYIKQLETQVQEQNENMRQLRQLLCDTDEIRIINSALVKELGVVEAQFASKEQELAIAVAKVEGMTQQLEEQRQNCRKNGLEEKYSNNQKHELDHLRKELLMRNELNHQQSVQIQVQKKLLAEKQKELAALDSHVEKLTEDLRQKKSRAQANHVDLSRPEEFDLEDGLWENVDNKYDVMQDPHEDAQHSRTLDTLAEEDEPVVTNGDKPRTSDIGRNSNFASTGRKSKVSKLATFFEAAAHINGDHIKSQHPGFANDVAQSLSVKDSHSLSLDENFLAAGTKVSPLSSPSSLSSLSSISSTSSQLPSTLPSRMAELKQGGNEAKTLAAQNLSASPDIRRFQSSLHNLKSAAISLSGSRSQAEPTRNESPSLKETRHGPEEMHAANVDHATRPNPLRMHESRNESSKVTSKGELTREGSESSRKHTILDESPAVQTARKSQLTNEASSLKVLRNGESGLTSPSGSTVCRGSQQNHSSPKILRTSAVVRLMENAASRGQQLQEKSPKNPGALEYETPENVGLGVGRDLRLSDMKWIVEGESSNVETGTKETILRDAPLNRSDTTDFSPKGRSVELQESNKDVGAPGSPAGNGEVSPRPIVKDSYVRCSDMHLCSDKDIEKKKSRRVILDPHAVLLDAALEGELEHVKQVIKNVEDPSTANSDGITALHNSVCGNHLSIVQFLVQYGCDVNLPDSHGWTPLHCAAVNNNLKVVQFLVEHGACIFATTNLERKTPAQCCDTTATGFFECSQYLQDIELNFGLVNGGRVYALYAYSASEQDELSFECGEELRVLRRGDNNEKEWWWAEGGRGQAGYIPRNLLGLFPRVAPEV